MAALEPHRGVDCNRRFSFDGWVLDCVARSAAAGRGARLLHSGGRSRGTAAAALHHAGGPLAAAGDARARRSALPRACCSPMRTSASRPITASIRWRSAAPLSQLLANGRIVSGRVDAHHAGGAAARAAHRTQLHRQAAPDGARDRDRAQTEQGRDPRALSEPRALWRQSRRRARRLARLFRQGAAPPDAGRGGAAGRAAAIAGAAPARPLRRCRAQRPRPRARSRRRGRRRAVRTRSSGPSTSRCRMGASRCRCSAPHAADAAVAAAPDARASIASPSTRRCRRASRSSRASAPARSGPTSRSRSWRSTTPPAKCMARVASADYFDSRRAGQVDMTRGDALAGLDAQAVHLWARLRGRSRSIRKR